MRLIKQDGRWIAVSSYDERALPKEAGFRWNPTAKHWWTDDKDKAFKLAAHGDDDVRAELAGVVVAKVEAVIASRATDAAIDVPIPAGLSLLPYQRAGIAFCAQRPNVLLADEMGLGKTIQAIGAINVDAAVRNVLVICPASLKFNWRNEMRKWLTRKMSIGVAASTSFPATDIVVINYDIVARNRAAIDARQWDMLICDEVHALKNGKAQRTKAILGGSIKKGEARAIPATRKLFLTGTPILNRPNELWTLMQAIDRDGLGRDFWHFHKRYCRAFKNRWGAWDMSGASNLDELQRRLREGVMIRRLKADVLTELPPKRRQVITLATNGAVDVVLAERAAYEERTADVRARIELASANENRAEYEAAIEELEAIEGVVFTEMAKLRHDTATAKIPYVIEHLHEAIEGSGKVVVFAHHHDVIDAIAVEFGAAAVTLTGKTSLDDRQAAVERFQSDPTCTLFVGNILAAGVGITLTKSSHVVFAEIDWRPAMLNQAEDRTHRIGQPESVLVQHLVFDESMDALMLQRILEKQSVIDSALDVGMAAPIAMPAQIAPPRPQEAATPAAPDIGQGMTTRQIAAVHEALRILAGLDPDQAAERNDVGFNKYDGRIGHSLASVERLTVRQAALGRRIVCKYHRQIGADLLAAMKG